jgi:hypothetical protein
MSTKPKLYWSIDFTHHKAVCEYAVLSFHHLPQGGFHVDTVQMTNQDHAFTPEQLVADALRAIRSEAKRTALA